jgi:glycosyltransferase involved in cell wall biosynthesis
MKVALSTSVGQRGRSGVAAYLFGLIDGLVRSAPDLQLTLIGLEEDRGLFAPWLDRCAWLPVAERWRPALRDVFWHQFLLPGVLRRGGFDLLHIPSYRRIVARAPCPQVVTIHDCAAFAVRGKYDAARMLYGRKVVPRLARRAQAVVTVSAATADDVARYLHLPRAGLHVVWNGIDHSRFRPQSAEALGAFRQRLGLARPYLLYVARLEHPAKNHLRLIEAYESLMREQPSLPHDLVLAGADWHGAEVIRSRVASSPLRERIRLPGFVAAADLPLWYGGATLMAYPSLFEGFGLPPVEAMACACPVVCSARGSLGEVVGDAARIVDPESPAEIVAGLREVLASPDAWVTRGLLRAGLFSWDAAASATAGIYRDVVRAAKTFTAQ